MTWQADGTAEGDEEMEIKEGLTFEDVQQEAAAKQRAFESQQAKASTSGSGVEKGAITLLPSQPYNAACQEHLCNHHVPHHLQPPLTVRPAAYRVPCLGQCISCFTPSSVTFMF